MVISTKSLILIGTLCFCWGKIISFSFAKQYSSFDIFITLVTFSAFTNTIQVVSFDEMKASEAYSIHKPLFCKEHPTEGLKYFCVACQVSISCFFICH